MRDIITLACTECKRRNLQHDEEQEEDDASGCELEQLPPLSCRKPIRDTKNGATGN